MTSLWLAEMAQDTSWSFPARTRQLQRVPSPRSLSRPISGRGWSMWSNRLWRVRAASLQRRKQGHAGTQHGLFSEWWLHVITVQISWLDISRMFSFWWFFSWHLDTFGGSPSPWDREMACCACGRDGLGTGRRVWFLSLWGNLGWAVAKAVSCGLCVLWDFVDLHIRI